MVLFFFFTTLFLDSPLLSNQSVFWIVKFYAFTIIMDSNISGNFYLYFLVYYSSVLLLSPPTILASLSGLIFKILFYPHLDCLGDFN